MDRNRTRAPHSPIHGLVCILLATAGLLLLAWLMIPSPVVKDPVQTELLCVQLVLSPEETVDWHPRTMVQRQTARAIVDHMATCREQNTLHSARDARESQPCMYVHFRTEDTYRVVGIGAGSGCVNGGNYVCALDGSGLATKLLHPEAMRSYILDQIGEELPDFPQK